MTEKYIDSVELAKQIRLDILDMANIASSSHTACALSCVDILAVLYSGIINHTVQNNNNYNRDRLILSKGHAGSALYATLAERGFFDKAQLLNHCSNGSLLSGHVSKYVNGVEVSTGSLGMGVGVAVGIAHGAKMNKDTHDTFVILGDGECNEGSVWEAFAYAAHHKLTNLVAIIDKNSYQSILSCDQTLSYKPYSNKFKAFNWHTIEVDGHDHNALRKAFSCRSDIAPTVIIANTIKGKGVSFMENEILWHYRPAQGEFYQRARREVESQ